MNTSRVYEPEMIINPNTRQIHIPRELYNIGVVNEDNAETVKIRIPRRFDGCDFGDKTCEIIFVNALGEKHTYPVDEKVVNENDIVLSWYIEKNVTKKEGTVQFIVTFIAETDGRGKSYCFSTVPAELNVLNSLTANTGAFIDPDNNNGGAGGDLDKTTLENLVNDSHKHDNKNILDMITSTIIDKINAAYNHITDKLKHVPDGGNIGQVVGKNADGDIAWIDVQTGGGGQTGGTSIVLDKVPTDGSLNGVESNGVYDELQKKQNKISGSVDEIVGFDELGNATPIPKDNIQMIDDNSVSTNKTWSSNKISSEIGKITSGTNDYKALTNKPSINGVELNDNVTTDDLGLNIPTKVSELHNDLTYQTENQVNSIVDDKIKDKVDSEVGKGLSSNDYTDEEKDKVANMINIVFSDTIPNSLDENTICFVYEG